MDKQVIKNWRGKVMGFIKTDDKGNKQVFDSKYKLLGTYRKDLNLTRDSSYRVIGKGDLTLTLIPMEK